MVSRAVRASRHRAPAASLPKDITALLTSERKILEFAADQNRCDTGNHHFLTSHVISFRRSETMDTARDVSFALSGVDSWQD
jgi:hypothetical protein